MNRQTPFSATTIFLPKWQFTCSKNSSVFVANILINPNSDLPRLSYQVWQIFHQVNTSRYQKLPSQVRTKKYTYEDVTHTNCFQYAVQGALNSIQENRYQKIVLAHAINVKSKTPFHIVDSLNQLRILHPDCYIFGTSNHQGQNFIGASPERLVSLHNQVLETDALAGSAPRGKTSSEDTYLGKILLNDEKERHEHQVVIDFIVQCLSRLGLTPHLSPPSLRQLSNIQHLWTPILAQVPTNLHLLEILAEFHPTPAVAGDPRNIACQEIQHYEAFDRGLYAGPLGWIDRHGNGEFIVGIRSALIDGCHARLYAGAGIVAGSIPEKELAEIKLKLQALIKALV